MKKYDHYKESGWIIYISLLGEKALGPETRHLAIKFHAALPGRIIKPLHLSVSTQIHSRLFRACEWKSLLTGSGAAAKEPTAALASFRAQKQLIALKAHRAVHNSCERECIFFGVARECVRVAEKNEPHDWRHRLPQRAPLTQTRADWVLRPRDKTRAPPPNQRQSNFTL